MKYSLMTSSFILFSLLSIGYAYESVDKEFQQYADSLQFIGKNSSEAYAKLASEGYACRAVGGIQTDIPTDEPLLLCAKRSGAPGCKKNAEIIIRLDWAETKLDPNAMPERNVKEVRAQCFAF